MQFFVVFEKFARAYLFQIALVISLITYTNTEAIPIIQTQAAILTCCDITARAKGEINQSDNQISKQEHK